MIVTCHNHMVTDPLGSSESLRATDGEFVDVYHTSSGTTDTPVQSGHVDFYVDECGVRVCTCPTVMSPNITSPADMTDNVIGACK